jgi:hypothetical protein
VEVLWAAFKWGSAALGLLSFALWVPTWAQQHNGESRQRLWLRGHRDRIHAVFLYTFLVRWVIMPFHPGADPGDRTRLWWSIAAVVIWLLVVVLRASIADRRQRQLYGPPRHALARKSRFGRTKNG